MLKSIEQFMEQNTALAVEYGVNLIAAALILIIGWVAAGWAKRLVLKRLDKQLGLDATVKPIMANLIRYTILILVIAAVLARFGVQTASIIAIIGAAGLAVGLALQGTLANLAASVMLLFLRPFKIGDSINAGGVAGTVVEIGLFLSQLRTPDGIYIAVPNSQLWGCAITNYSRLPTRRIDLPVGIGYGDDIDHALQVLTKILTDDARVLGDPAPEVMVSSLGDSAVVLKMRCWVNRDDYWGVLFDMTKSVKLSLDDAGISIPYPQRGINVISPAA